MKHVDERDSRFSVNTLGISAVEFFWGLGLPVIVESTFLQLFLVSLGASDVVLGLVPAMFSAGIALFAMVSAYLTSHLHRKRSVVILTHLAASMPLMIFGGTIMAAGYTDCTIPLFLVFYFIYAMAIGVTLPVWLNFLVKIFSEKKTVPGLSVMMVFQTSGRILGSLFIMKLVSALSFSPEGVGSVFLGIGSVFFASSFFFLLVKEPAGNNGVNGEAHSVRSLYGAFIEIVTHRNYMFFIFSFIEAYACITAISFYASYATRYRGIDSAHAAGLFVGFVYLGSLSATVVLGWLNAFSLKTKFFISKLFSLSGVLLLLAAENLAVFLAISFLLGMSRGVSMFGYSPGVKRISGRDDATDYFAVSPFVSLPVSFGIPYLCGHFLHQFSRYGVRAYQAMFLFLGVIIILSMIFLLLADFGGGEESGRRR